MSYDEAVARVFASLPPVEPATEVRSQNGTADTEPATGNEAWPVLDPAALHGPIGSFVAACSPYTEADPVAVLVTALVVVGTNIGRGPHVLAGNARHPACLYESLVGRTAKGGKGTSWSVVRAMAAEAFGTEWVDSQVKGGFGSGEKLVDELVGTPENPVLDNRMIVVEPEMARMLKVAGRDSSILSMTLRNGWDGFPLEARSRGVSSVAAEHHIGVVAHITGEELRLRLGEADQYNGFSNRFLWVAVQRARRLPAGGNVPEGLIASHGALIGAAVTKARRRGRVVRTPEAEERWAVLYDIMGDDEPDGLLAAVVSRAEQQVLRLSLLYAMLDGAPDIDVVHLNAAWAVWSYCRQSAAVLFGDRSVNPDAARLLDAVRRSGSAGLGLKAQMAVFGRNRPAKAMEAMRSDLESRGLVETHPDPEDTGGRSRTVTVAREYEVTNLHELTNERGSGVTNLHELTNERDGNGGLNSLVRVSSYPASPVTVDVEEVGEAEPHGRLFADEARSANPPSVPTGRVQLLEGQEPCAECGRGTLRYADGRWMHDTCENDFF